MPHHDPASEADAPPSGSLSAREDAVRNTRHAADRPHPPGAVERRQKAAANGEAAGPGEAQPGPAEAAVAAVAWVGGVVDRLDAATRGGGAADEESATYDGEAQELLEALEALREVRDQLAGWEPRLIRAARDAGVSWAQLAPALGVASRQAAERRYLRLNPNTDDPAMTGEQRVQAARDQRAGDRAVADWARNNAADLRRLAGQVTALAGLDSATQASVDRINDALGNDDSAALLGPLQDAARQLTRDHPALAERISELSDRTDQVRQATRDRRPGRAG